MGRGDVRDGSSRAQKNPGRFAMRRKRWRDARRRGPRATVNACEPLPRQPRFTCGASPQGGRAAFLEKKRANRVRHA